MDKVIQIEDRAYSCRRFNSFDCVTWGDRLRGILPALRAAVEDDDPAQFAAALVPSLKDGSLTTLLKQAIGQCFTPENQSLADEAVFNAWFSKYPGDMLALGARAIPILVSDYLPSLLATAASVHEGHA